MKVCAILLLCVLKQLSAFEYEQLDIEYDSSSSSSTIPVSSTSTTSTSSSSSTSTTISTTTIDTTPFSVASSTPVNATRNTSKTRGSNRVDPPIEVGGFRAAQGGENVAGQYRHPNERRKNPKCVNEDDLMKKIHEIFLASPPSEQQIGDSSEWRDGLMTTTMRVERDHPYQSVRNFI